jgi:hypothetical protein
VLFECRAFGIQVMFPINASSAIAEHIRVFDAVHSIYNVMGNLRLQFQHKTTEHIDLLDWQESRLLQDSDMIGNRSKGPIDTVERLIRAQFAFKMVSSQVCLHEGEFGQGRVYVSSMGAARYHLIGETLANTQGKSDLPKNSGACPKSLVITGEFRQSH